MTSTGVIQVKQGIGDVIWHLPFIKAIAAAAPGGKVTFLTLPSSRAQELLQAEPCIARTLYFEHGGNELQRGLHLMRLVALLLPTAALPSGVCEPPKPAAHRFQRASKICGGALVNMA